MKKKRAILGFIALLLIALIFAWLGSVRGIDPAVIECEKRNPDKRELCQPPK